jgi:hypothetical protein
MSEVPEANPADVQEQQQTLEGNPDPDLHRLERDLGDDASEADVVEQSQD